jgi:hypothetical protein
MRMQYGILFLFALDPLDGFVGASDGGFRHRREEEGQCGFN